jgi:hypothetical protein
VTAVGGGRREERRRGAGWDGQMVYEGEELDGGWAETRVPRSVETAEATRNTKCSPRRQDEEPGMVSLYPRIPEQWAGVGS